MKPALSIVALPILMLCLVVIAMDWAEYKDTGACQNCGILQIVRPDIGREK